MSLRDFIEMSGYGAYIWSCYAITFAVLIWMAVNARRQLAGEIVRAQRRVQVAATEEKS